MANRLDFTLEPGDQETLARISGPLDAHLRLIESRLGVAVHNRGPRFNLTGPKTAVQAAGALIHDLHRMAQEEPVSLEQVHTALQTAHVEGLAEPEGNGGNGGDPSLRLKRAVIRGRGPRQAKYLAAIAQHDLSFGIGPAGTGKTFLAVAAAVAALEQDRVQRLVLVRPAVEAGERLGFLPGDLAQKIDPYLRPMYDALYELMGFDQTARLMERQVIEVAPLAYMRGRTLNEAFIILDEAQNTTVEQMKMFLTRIGFGSTAVVNGDITQVDLPRGQRSGLKHAMQILNDVEGVHITRFQAGDVVRHPLVQRIVEAYDAHDSASGKPDAAPEPGAGGAAVDGQDADGA